MMSLVTYSKIYQEENQNRKSEVSKKEIYQPSSNSSNFNTTIPIQNNEAPPSF